LSDYKLSELRHVATLVWAIDNNVSLVVKEIPTWHWHHCAI